MAHANEDAHAVFREIVGVKRKALPRGSSAGSRRKSTDAQAGGRWWSIEDCVSSRSTGQFSVQTFIVFMPVSASVLVLNTPLSTIVVVVVDFLSTMVHFFVVPSRTM